MILALAEQAKAKGKTRSFIPYRNSKLTRVLQESLGGNSLTVMIACVSSAAPHLEESLSTLQYADRAKAIQLKAVKNEQMSEVGRLRNEVNELRRKLSEKLGGATEQSEGDREQLRAYQTQSEPRPLCLLSPAAPLNPQPPPSACDPPLLLSPTRTRRTHAAEATATPPPFPG